jgi:hypothetical protein
LSISLAVGLFLVLGKPEVTSYGGLSALAVGSFVYLGLLELHGQPVRRLWGWLTLAAVAVKLGVEIYTADSMLYYPVTRSFQPVWESHALAALTALSFFFASRVKPGRWPVRLQETGR